MCYIFQPQRGHDLEVHTNSEDFTLTLNTSVLHTIDTKLV